MVGSAGDPVAGSVGRLLNRGLAMDRRARRTAREHQGC